ncbi:MAG: hypothetical protein GY863_03430 [bacterium]|nr:hypothetical protein [bacterium]
MTKKTTQKEQTEQLVKLMKKWQKIEKKTVEITEKIGSDSDNPLIQLIMEIIKQDSIMHEKVQQFIIDSYTKKAVSLTPEELGLIWEAISKHAEMEKETIEIGEEAKKNCKSFVQLNLLTYLLEDEKKHDRILSQLEGFKSRIYPYM